MAPPSHRLCSPEGSRGLQQPDRTGHPEPPSCQLPDAGCRLRACWGGPRAGEGQAGSALALPSGCAVLRTQGLRRLSLSLVGGGGLWAPALPARGTRACSGAPGRQPSPASLPKQRGRSGWGREGCLRVRRAARQGRPGTESLTSALWLPPVPDRVCQWLRVPGRAGGRRPRGLRRGAGVPVCAQQGPVRPRRQDQGGLQHLVSGPARPGRPRPPALRGRAGAPPHSAGRALARMRVLLGAFGLARARRRPAWGAVLTVPRGLAPVALCVGWGGRLQTPLPLSAAPAREGAGPAPRPCATAPVPSTGAATTSPSMGSTTTSTDTAPTWLLR